MYSKYRFIILGINMVVYMMLMAILVSFSISGPMLIKEFSLTDMQLNYGYIAFTSGLVVSLWWGGRFFDRYGMKKTMVLGSLLFLIPQFLIPFVKNWNIILFLRFIQGNVVSMFPGFVTLNSLWFPKKEHGLASGIFMGGLSLGTAVGNYLCSKILPIFGWKNTFQVLGVLALLLIMLWFVFSQKKPPMNLEKKIEINRKGDDTPGNTTIYRNPITWLLAIIMLGNCWQLYAMYGVTQSMLFDYGYSLETVGLLCLILGIIGVFSTPAGGIISDKISTVLNITKARIVSMLIGFIIAFFSTLLCPFLVKINFNIAIFAMIFMGMGVPWTNGPYWALPSEIYPSKLAGEGAGFAGFIGNTAAIFGPLIATFLGNSYGWVSSMSFLAIGPFISIIGCVVLFKIVKIKLL
jgi:MFS family permease